MFDFEGFARGGSAACAWRGDALRFLSSLPDASVDAFVMDPPYGIELQLHSSRRHKGAPGRAIAGDGRAEARRLWRAWVPEAWRVARPDTAHVVFGSWKSPWMFDALSAHFRVVGCIAWDKRIIGLGYYLRPQWEMAYVCVKGRPPRRGTAPSDVWEQARIVRTKHPCEKPVPLLRRAVRLVSDPGQLVADPFAGIFSAGVAAVLEGRRFIGSEIDGRYVKLGDTRLTAAATEYSASANA